MSNITFKEMMCDAAAWLRHNRTCTKHNVEHTGKHAYELDFYDYLGEVERGKRLVWHLLSKIITSPDEVKVFYPGHLNPRNMSQNVIDTGAAVDCIARFAHRRYNAFSSEEHVKIQAALREVVEGYLALASRDKKITNQRLWGLTGIASFARYVGEEEHYRLLAQASIAQAFVDMTVDGFFRYSPRPERRSAPYDNISAYYQSRHTAFIWYVLRELGMDTTPYQKQLEQSTAALLAMYTEDGYKDQRMECKRWYWLSKYEVVSHSFDAYALSVSSTPEASTAFHNALYQIRQCFFDGHLHSHKGIDLNFQCPTFWTAHLAWLVRISGIEKHFDEATHPWQFSFRLVGKEVYTDTTQTHRIMINTLLGPRNPTVGVYKNGLPHQLSLGRFPAVPYSYLFSVREAVNHARAALRGLHVLEAGVRLASFVLESLLMLLPVYSIGYGRVTSFVIGRDSITVQVIPATKYGTEASRATPVKIRF